MESILESGAAYLQVNTTSAFTAGSKYFRIAIVYLSGTLSVVIFLGPTTFNPETKPRR